MIIKALFLKQYFLQKHLIQKSYFMTPGGFKDSLNEAKHLPSGGDSDTSETRNTFFQRIVCCC